MKNYSDLLKISLLACAVGATACTKDKSPLQNTANSAARTSAVVSNFTANTQAASDLKASMGATPLSAEEARALGAKGSNLAVVNGASYKFKGQADGSVAPNSIVAIFGPGTSYPCLNDYVPGKNTNPRAKVTAGGLPAQIIFAVAGQVNVILPDALQDGNNSIVLTCNDGASYTSDSFTVSNANPGIFTANARGVGVPEAQAWNSGSYDVIYDNNLDPVAIQPDLPYANGFSAGDNILVLYGTGLQYAATKNIRVELDGQPMQISGIGSVEGYRGLDQVNVLLTGDLRDRKDVDHTLQLIVEGKPSNPVTIRIAGLYEDFHTTTSTTGKEARYAFTVPANVYTLEVQAFGGEGGGGLDCNGFFNYGQSGEYKSGSIDVIPGETYQVYIQGGAYGYNGDGGKGAAAAVYAPNGNEIFHAAGGHGYVGCGTKGETDGRGGMINLTWNESANPNFDHGDLDLTTPGYTYLTVPAGVLNMAVMISGGGVNGESKSELIDVVPGEQLTIYVQSGSDGGSIAIYDSKGNTIIHAQGDRTYTGELIMSW